MDINQLVQTLNNSPSVKLLKMRSAEFFLAFVTSVFDEQMAIGEEKLQMLLENWLDNQREDITDENYIAKLVNTVSYLSKEDLADMAESLVRMTYLKRRITSEEESVGGPVDVAEITKGDGFVWLKRKHYFSAELNPHYFERTKLE